MSKNNLKDPIQKNITLARVKLLFNQPFFGNLTTRLQLIDATDEGWCPTAAVDGRKIYYNRNFFKELNVEEIVFVLCHEVCHVAFSHFGRRAGRDPMWWNMANDYVINGMLVQEKIGSMPVKKFSTKEEDGSTAQRVGLYDQKYLGWTSEAVYDDLEKRKVTKELTLDVHIEMGKDKGGKKGSRADVDDGSGKITIKQGDNGDKKDKKSGGSPDISEGELKKIREELKNAIIEASQQAAGRMPLALKRLVESLVEPKINWRELLELQIQSCIKNDFTFMKQARKTFGGRVFLPGMNYEDTIDVMIALDASGSISDTMLKDFLGEIKGIMDSYHDYKIHVVTFDTRTYNPASYTQENGDELLAYDVKGGGGTDFMCVWEYMQENDLQPMKLIMFTDGEPCGDWGVENYVDTVFVIHSNPKKLAPFGTTAHYTPRQGIDDIVQG